MPITNNKMPQVPAAAMTKKVGISNVGFQYINRSDA